MDVIRKPNIFDVQDLARKARLSDKIEVQAFHGNTIEECLNGTPGLYKNSYVWEVNGNLVCMFGVTPVDEDRGVVWLLGTDMFDKYSRLFAVKCKKVFEDVVKDYRYIFNYVHAQHDKSLRWLKWLGFDIHPAEPVGINGEMFHFFERYNHV